MNRRAGGAGKHGGHSERPRPRETGNAAVKPLDWRRVARDTDVVVKLVEGTYRDGKAEFAEPVAPGDLRRRLASFAQYWDRPEMGAYDATP